MRVYSPDEARTALDAAESIYGSMLGRQLYGDHICLAAFPLTEHGSPDLIVEDGVGEGAEVTGDWADQLVAALDGAHTQAAIARAIDRAVERFDVAALADVLFERMLRGLQLGGLDVQNETERAIRATAFRLKAEDRPFSQLPRQAAAELWEKRQVLDPETYAALSDKLRQRAFSFAGAATEEMRNVVHAELAKRIREGTIDLREFKKFAAQRLESAGWTPANPTHVETILRTNVGSAMAAGRHAKMTQPDVLAALPYWQIKGVNDARQRPTHKAASGIVLPANHEFWRTAYPPFGFNCRCSVTARTASWLKRTGTPVGPVPRGLPDPGFTSGTRNMVTVPASLVPKPKPAPAPTGQTPERDARRADQPAAPLLEQQVGLPAAPQVAPPAPEPTALPKKPKKKTPTPKPAALPTPAPAPLPAQVETPKPIDTGLGLPKAPTAKDEPPKPIQLPPAEKAPPVEWTWEDKGGYYAMVPVGQPNAKPRARLLKKPNAKGVPEWFVQNDTREIGLGKKAGFNHADKAVAKLESGGGTLIGAPPATKPPTQKAKPAAKPAKGDAAPLPAPPPGDPHQDALDALAKAKAEQEKAFNAYTNKKGSFAQLENAEKAVEYWQAKVKGAKVAKPETPVPAVLPRAALPPSAASDRGLPTSAGEARVAAIRKQFASPTRIDLRKDVKHASLPTVQGAQEPQSFDGKPLRAEAVRAMSTEAAKAFGDAREGIRQFTGDDYTAIRAAEAPRFRLLPLERRPQVCREIHEGLTSAIQQGHAAKNLEVWRGVRNVDINVVQGWVDARSFDHAGTASTSRDRNVAVDFLGGGFVDNGKVLVSSPETGKVHVLYRLRNQTGVPIETVSQVDFELEVLVRAGTKYRMTAAHWLESQEGRVLLIEGEEDVAAGIL